jgi:hypothetical protein
MLIQTKNLSLLNKKGLLIIEKKKKNLFLKINRKN